MRLSPRFPFSLLRVIARCVGSPGVCAALLLALIPQLAEAQSSTYTVEAPSVPSTPGGLVPLPITLDSSLGVDLAGISVAVCNVPGVVEPVVVTVGAALAALNGGAGPDFVVNDIGLDGFSSGIVFSSSSTAVLAPATQSEILVVEYQVSAAIAGVTVPLPFCIYQSVESIAVTAGGGAISVTGIDGEIVVSGTPSTIEFIRGDTSEDGAVSITDAIVLFGQLLGAVPDGLCPQNGDVNADGERNIADVVSLLTAFFTPGPAIAPPFPACGTSAVVTGLPCLPIAICP